MDTQNNSVCSDFLITVHIFSFFKNSNLCRERKSVCSDILVFVHILIFEENLNVDWFSIFLSLSTYPSVTKSGNIYTFFKNQNVNSDKNIWPSLFRFGFVKKMKIWIVMWKSEQTELLKVSTTVLVLPKNCRLVHIHKKNMPFLYACEWK